MSIKFPHTSSSSWLIAVRVIVFLLAIQFVNYELQNEVKLKIEVSGDMDTETKEDANEFKLVPELSSLAVSFQELNSHIKEHQAYVRLVHFAEVPTPPPDFS